MVKTNYLHLKFRPEERLRDKMVLAHFDGVSIYVREHASINLHIRGTITGIFFSKIFISTIKFEEKLLSFWSSTEGTEASRCRRKEKHLHH